ncbi:MAG: ABC transporter ATP-binding protein [Chloroflexota bacterium]
MSAKKTPFNNWKRIMSYIVRYRVWAAAALVGAVAGNLLAVAIPWIIGAVIDEGVQRGDANFMLLAGLGMVGLGILRGVAGFLSRYFGEKLSHYAAFDLRNQMYDKVQHLSFTYHDNAHIGTIVTRAISDVGEIQRYFAFGLMDSFNVGVLVIGSLAVMFYTSPVLTLVALLPMLPLVFLSRGFAMSVDPMWRTIMERQQTLSNHIQENAMGAEVVRVFAREQYELDKFDETNDRLFHDFMNLITRWATFLPISAFIAASSTSLVLIVGGFMESRGMAGITVGTVVAFNAYILQMSNPLRFLGFVILLTTQALSSSDRVFEILDEPVDIDSKPDALKLEEARGEVVFEDVTFTYTGESKPALKNISFTANPGEVIGIVGSTGSGKSSIVNLIPRFYDATEGRVLVDGHDVRDVDVNSLRANIGNVMQRSLLFSATIGENIAFGKTGASEEAIVAAAMAADAHDFIMEFENGYDTVVGERGVTLSGGQRQRTSIARALLINPRILILDDSTSSVDTRTEKAIQEALEHLMEGRTTFIIAQRLTSVMKADKILVLQDGAIVERGKHDDLIAKDGVYADIYKLQMEDQDRVRAEEAFDGLLKFTEEEERRSTQEFRRLVDAIGGD